MPKQTIRVEGLSELKDALEELPKATGTNVLKRALTQAADPIQAQAESLAPVMTGKLKRSIIVGTKLSSTQKKSAKKINKVEIYVGPGQLRQATLQEFGTVNQRPQPFLRPAWSANVRPALNSIREILADEIEKARARIARKIARLAALNSK